MTEANLCGAPTGAGPARRLRSRRGVAGGLAAAFAGALALPGAAATPELKVTTALSLKGAPENENFASKNQALNVWEHADGKEHIVSLVHHHGNMDVRADDKQYAITWESDGTTLREVKRIQMSCPDVELNVPNRGPFAFEARLDMSPYSLHPECSCPTDLPCPQSVQVESPSGTSFLMSPLLTHFVKLQNEWEEYIADPAILNRFRIEYKSDVVAVPSPGTGCPGTRDQPIGTHDVTFEMLNAANVAKIPDIEGKWCLVRRGGCDETAKVKWCELSGAKGTIIADHGSFSQAGDQEIVVRYNRAKGERAMSPVLFVSKDDGDALNVSGIVTVSVGPNIGGAVGSGFTKGSGIIVHNMMPGVSGMKSYASLFKTAGWVEVSDLRDIMFVCLPSLAEIRLYNISDPMTDIPLLSTIENRPCSRDSLHDYRILDFKDEQGAFTTILVDPADSANQLFYYDTEDPTTPDLMFTLHANWEATQNGLGQIRPGGPSGRYHFVTWHCSTIYCDKGLGDALYVMDSYRPEAPPRMIPLGMMSHGSFARDISCGSGTDGVCLVSLAWDGMVAVEPNDGMNRFRVIASYHGQEFRDDAIPLGRIYLKMYSGAQKVYASKLNSRSFYVEHSEFALRQLNVGDTLRAVQSRDLFAVKLANYDAQEQVNSPPSVLYGGGDSQVDRNEGGRRRRGGRGRGRRRGGDDDDRRGGRRSSRVVIGVLAAVASCLACTACGLAYHLLKKRKSTTRNVDLQQPSPPLPPDAVDDMNVVVGRPIEEGGGGDAAAQGHAMPSGAAAAAAGGDDSGAPSATKQSV